MKRSGEPDFCKQGLTQKQLEHPLQADVQIMCAEDNQLPELTNSKAKISEKLHLMIGKHSELWKI